MTVLAPTSEAEACALVAEAVAQRRPLAVAGGGTRAAVGRPVQHEGVLSSRALSGITLYEPAELVIAARAGTPLAVVERALADKGQMLAFEPMDHRPLLGTHGEPTVGGLVAANASGPRRITVGACRDSLIGVRFVNGRGEAVKSGGRVMKNVTGLDLAKLLAGSWGTLGFLTEATFKVQPRPERMATLALRGLDDARAVAALSAALGSPFEVTGAAHMPANLSYGTARTLLRVESFAFSVEYRVGELRRLLRSYGPVELVDIVAADVLWRELRDASRLAAPADAAVWRISTAPSRGPALVAAIVEQRPARWFYDWGGGLIWLATDAGEGAGAEVVRAAVAAAGGHATLVRAPDDVRAAVDVFQPQAMPLRHLTLGIKHALDPERVFEPGRMYAGV